MLPKTLSDTVQVQLTVSNFLADDVVQIMCVLLIVQFSVGM